MVSSQMDLWRAGRLRLLTLALSSFAAFALIGVGGASAATTPSFPSQLQAATSIQMPPAENISSPFGAYDFGGGETSCGSAGFCASVAGYGSIAGDGTLVIPINNGVPAPAVQVGLPANAAGIGYGDLNDISCSGASSCVAVGSYEAEAWNGEDWTDDTEAVVVPVANGDVGTAVEVALPANAVADSTGDQDAALNSVSCDPSGTCVAVGSYVDNNGNTEAMVVSISNGQAGTAVEVAPPAGNALSDSTGKQDSELNSVSCEASGACVAVGDYLDNAGTPGNEEAMVVPVSSAGAAGTSTMLTLPGDVQDSNTSTSPDAYLSQVSCPASGSCAAIGEYNGSSSNESMVTSISAAGAALPAIEVVSTVADTAGPYAEANGVGCGAAGCDVVGAYDDTNDSQQALVIPVSGGSSTSLGTEVSVTLPGDAVAAGTGDQDAWLSHISCSAAGSCLASGSYTGDYQGVSADYGDEFSDTNLNAMLVGVSGSSVDTAISAPLPADASTNGRLSIGWGVGCGATGSCAVFAKYLQGFSTSTQLTNTLECFEYSDGENSCLCPTGGTEQPYVISAQAPLTIAPGQVTTTVTAGVTSISLASAASGGWGPYLWSVAAGDTLPAGLSLDPFTGVISGTPQVPGTYTLWVRADSPGTPAQNAEASLTLTVGAASTTATVTSTTTTVVTSPPIVPAAVKREPSLIVVRGNLRDHGGAVNVHLRCHSWGPCNGTVTLSWHGHLISKTSHLSIPAGHTQWVKVHLNAAGIKDTAGLRKPRHGFPTMNVTVTPKLTVGKGIPNGRPMWVI